MRIFLVSGGKGLDYSRLIVAAALQRYIEPPPVAVRLRDVAVALARKNNAPVDVIAVEAPVELMPGVESTEEKLSLFVEPIQKAGVEVHPHLMSGKPSEQILHFLDTGGPGKKLLLVGSHSKRGLLDIGMGGNASILVRESPCPVLMVWPTREEAERAQELMIPGYPFVFPYG